MIQFIFGLLNAFLCIFCHPFGHFHWLLSPLSKSGGEIHISPFFEALVEEWIIHSNEV